MAAMQRSNHGRQSTRITLNERFGSVEGTTAWLVTIYHLGSELNFRFTDKHSLAGQRSTHHDPSALGTDLNSFAAAISSLIEPPNFRIRLFKIVSHDGEVSRSSHRIEIKLGDRR